MTKGMLDALMAELSADIARLPLGAVQLAGALVAAHPYLPGKLSNWVMQEMGKRVDMREVSPVAEAAMRIFVFAESFDKDYGFQEVQSQYALIKAMGKERELHIAVAFFQTLFMRFEEALQQNYEPGAEVLALMQKLRRQTETVMETEMMAGSQGAAPDIKTFALKSMVNNQETLLSHLAAIIAGSTDAIITKSLDGIVTGWNAGAQKIFGYSPEEMLGQPLLRMFPQDRVQEESFILERLKLGERVEHFETIRKHKDGRDIHVSVTISPIFDAKGQVVGASKIARDISERIKLENTSRQLEMIVSSSDDAIIGKTLSGVVTSWNSGAEKIFGYSAAEMIGTPVERLIPSERRVEESLILERLKKSQSIDHYETVRLRKDGSQVFVSVTISPMRDSTGEIIGASKIARDITGRKLAEQQLLLTSSVFTHANEGIAIADADGVILDVNDALMRISGFERAEIIGHLPTMFRSSRQGPEVMTSLLNTLKLQDHCQGEVWSRRKDGESYAGLLTISTVRNAEGAVQNYVGIFADITALKQKQDQLERIAHYDPLTGLPNRILLADRLQQAMVMSKRQGSNVGVLYLDLDGFKAINEAYGQDFGDEVLILISKKIRDVLREVDTLGRIGGDEFVAILEGVHSDRDCMDLADKVLRACAVPMGGDDGVLRLSASIGMTIYPLDDADSEQLLRHADQAMVEAKQTGKNRCQMFDSQQHTALRHRIDMIDQLALALSNEEFVLHYQPKVNMRTGEVIGVEALIRWNHPVQGLIGPAGFLPVVEGHVLSDGVCDWVIRSALHQMRLWQASGLHLRVSVNVGARQLQQGDFPVNLSRILAAFPQVDPASLEIEVLETSALEDTESVTDVMQACRRLGVTFAVDDFGTGYSSLTYLKRLPAGVLKVDQSFVRDMLTDREDLAIVQGVIGLAKAFNRTVLAEGVETVAHGLKLLSLGCELAQGYGISRPIAAKDIPDWISRWKPDHSWTRVI